MTDQTYRGKITAYENGFYTVEAPDAPSYLRTMFLNGSQIEIAKELGNTGTLVYRTNSRSGLWYLHELSKGTEREK